MSRLIDTWCEGRKRLFFLEKRRKNRLFIPLSNFSPWRRATTFDFILRRPLPRIIDCVRRYQEGKKTVSSVTKSSKTPSCNETIKTSVILWFVIDSRLSILPFRWRYFSKCQFSFAFEAFKKRVFECASAQLQLRHFNDDQNVDEWTEQSEGERIDEIK